MVVVVVVVVGWVVVGRVVVVVVGGGGGGGGGTGVRVVVLGRGRVVTGRATVVDEGPAVCAGGAGCGWGVSGVVISRDGTGNGIRLVSRGGVSSTGVWIVWSHAAVPNSTATAATPTAMRAMLLCTEAAPFLAARGNALRLAGRYQVSLERVMGGRATMVAVQDRVRLTAVVHGEVQGVGFRWWTRRRATELQLAGHARNLADGRVEVVAEGPRPACERLLDVLRAGATPGRVDRVAERWEAASGEPAGFVEC